MSPKKAKRPKSTTVPISSTSTAPIVFAGRDGLGAYTADPTAFPSSRVIYYDDKWVVVNDLYPKASIHLLLLSRDTSKHLLHPFEVFEDLVFLQAAKEAAEKLKKSAASELRRKFGRMSAQDKQREEVMSSDTITSTLPTGRDWESEIKIGVHAFPSMNHLHVHILSRDMHSECMRHRKHYNSFNTPFLVGLEDLPLPKSSPRRHPGREGYLDRDLICWRCGKGFGNRFRRLKDHLDEEFEDWKRE